MKMHPWIAGCPDFEGHLLPEHGGTREVNCRFEQLMTMTYSDSSTKYIYRDGIKILFI
jgi:hypothetical protein